MPLVVVADADARERIRCVRCIAAQTSVSAVGAATWEELEQVVEGGPVVSVLFYAGPLPGEPPDATSRIRAIAQRVVLSSPAAEASSAASGASPMVVPHPIPEETLILMARAAGSVSARHKVSFAPADLLQMVCQSGESLILIVSNGAADTGVIEVREGHVWTAFDALGVGEDAFARLVRSEMRARVRPATETGKVRTIHKDLSELLLDAARRMDEGEIVCPPPLSTRRIEDLVASPAEIAEKVRSLTAEAKKLLVTRNYNEAARVLLRLQELDPSSVLVRANLEQLHKLGYPK